VSHICRGSEISNHAMVTLEAVCDQAVHDDGTAEVRDVAALDMEWDAESTDRETVWVTEWTEFETELTVLETARLVSVTEDSGDSAGEFGAGEAVDVRELCLRGGRVLDGESSGGGKSRGCCRVETIVVECDWSLYTCLIVCEWYRASGCEYVLTLPVAELNCGRYAGPTRLLAFPAVTSRTGKEFMRTVNQSCHSRAMLGGCVFVRAYVTVVNCH
jgi:hypothetical protein